MPANTEKTSSLGRVGVSGPGVGRKDGLMIFVVVNTSSRIDIGSSVNLMGPEYASKPENASVDGWGIGGGAYTGTGGSGAAADVMGGSTGPQPSVAKQIWSLGRFWEVNDDS